MHLRLAEKGWEYELYKKKFGGYRDGLLPYQIQGLELSENAEGLEYRNMVAEIERRRKVYVGE